MSSAPAAGNEPTGQRQHHLGEHWSASNPIPTIQEFIKRMEKRDREAYHDTNQEHEQTNEGLQDAAIMHKPREVFKSRTRVVRDPITDKEIEVEDHDESSMVEVKNPRLSVPNANLGRSTTVKTHQGQPMPQYKKDQDATAPPDPIAEGTTSDVPIRGEKTNILFHPTPTVSYKPMFDHLERRATVICVGIGIAIIILGRTFGGSLWGLIPLSLCIACGVWLWAREVIQSGRNMEWHNEQLRGETATANLLPESVEWINTFLTVFWSLINPEMLAPTADTIEDVMQASVPGVIQNVHIREIDQGTNAFRVLSIRALPDSHVEDMKNNIHQEDKKNKDSREAAAIEQGGSYYNMELSFAYHAKPTDQSASSRAQNIHMNLVFYLGVKQLIGVPFPVFVELSEFMGTVRLRFQMSPEPPFMKQVTFSLVGIPHVTAGCMPMTRHGVNIVNLPVISNFVNYAIKAVCEMYAAPKSMTIDLSQKLKGDDIDKDTDALGVMWVRINRATGLSKQDVRGSQGGGSDPYINLSFSKYGKPMYCTRVITDDLNPIWEETAALLVTPELIKADEKLSVELWDSDRTTADDIVGKFELSIRKMLQHPGKMYPYVSELTGMDENSKMPGHLHWEVGFFSKPRLRPELRSDGKNRNLPKLFKGDARFEDPKGAIQNEEQDAVTHTPLDPLWPSGVLHMVVHQIVNLELANIKGSKGNRKGREYEPAKPYGESSDEQGEGLPTSYVQIILNDELIYKTRSKAVSSRPTFSTGTETFVRDWRSATINFVVRDERCREHDPILGVVPIKLSELFQTSSQVTRWYSLDGGIGFGRIRISLLFRHVQTKLPPNLLGLAVGTFEFSSNKIVLENFVHHAKIKLRTGGSTSKIPRKLCWIAENKSAFDLSDEDLRKSIRLAVRYRYRSPVVFEIHTQRKHGVAYAVLWLRHLVDNEVTDVDIPIWTTKRGARLTQNYVTEENWKANEVSGLEDLTEVGRMKLRCRFSPGLDECHKPFIFDNVFRETYEAWEASIDQGNRSGTVAVEVPGEIQTLHAKSLVQARDALKQADPEERKRWLDKHGQDWSSAFGHDPRAYMDSGKAAELGRHTTPHLEVEDSRIESGDHDDRSSATSDDSDDDSASSSSESDGKDQGLVPSRPSSRSNAPRAGAERVSKPEINKGNRRSEYRQHRGLMQWKPARNAVFAKDEVKFGFQKVKKLGMGALTGREPDVETDGHA